MHEDLTPNQRHAELMGELRQLRRALLTLSVAQIRASGTALAGELSLEQCEQEVQRIWRQVGEVLSE